MASSQVKMEKPSKPSEAEPRFRLGKPKSKSHFLNTENNVPLACEQFALRWVTNY